MIANTNNEILLRSWLLQTLADNPDIFKKNGTPVDVYADLQDIWLREIQDAMRVIAGELLKKIDQK